MSRSSGFAGSVPASIVDVSEPLNTLGKESPNISHTMYLGETCLVASIMMSTYESPSDQIYNHYTIDVEIPHLDDRCAVENKPDFCQRNPHSYTVIFQRELRPEDIGQYFRNKRMEDVVRFDKDTNIVRFDAGNKTFEYRLPMSNPALKWEVPSSHPLARHD